MKTIPSSHNDLYPINLSTILQNLSPRSTSLPLSLLLFKVKHQTGEGKGLITLSHIQRTDPKGTLVCLTYNLYITTYYDTGLTNTRGFQSYNYRIGGSSTIILHPINTNSAPPPREYLPQSQEYYFLCSPEEKGRWYTLKSLFRGANLVFRPGSDLRLTRSRNQYSKGRRS